MSETTATVTLLTDGVLIERLEVPHREVADYLHPFPGDKRPHALVQAIRVGVFCLQHAVTAQDTDFVRREIDRMLGELETKTKAIVPAVEQDLVGKLGTDPGQALAPVAEVVRSAEKTIKERLEDVRKKLDPSNPDSDLSQALAKLRDLLDPKRKGSIQDVLSEAVNQVTAKDGDLATHVKDKVADAIKPLQDKIDNLAQQLVAQQKVKEALAGTTAKGRPYEDEVVETLRAWFGRGGVTIEHVGGDNQPGDVVLMFPPEGVTEKALRIVIEARDREDGHGHKRISDDLEAAMQYRAAAGAVYVTRTRAGLAAEIGDWGESRTTTGPYVATVNEFLAVAVRLVVVLLRLEAVRASVAAAEVGAVEPLLQRIRTALKRLTAIQGQVASGRGALEAISREADALREEIRDALRQIEDLLRLSAKAEVSG
jgi:hypothetical protein